MSSSAGSRPTPTSLEPERDAFARALRGFGPVGLVALVVVTLFSGILGPFRAALPLLWAWRSRTPWGALGLVRPRSWLATIVFGALTGVALKLLMKSVVMPLLGAPPVNAPFQYLVGNTAALPGTLLLVIVGAGFGEEVTFRGFLYERLECLFGGSARARTVIVIGASLLFGAFHYPEQGLPGAEQAAIVGLVVGTIYATTRRLWFPVMVHAAFDIAAVLIIYRGLEARIAHLFFR